MSTHASLGVKFPDGEILGCYVHYDGGTLKPRIVDYLKKHTMTNLVLLIIRAQTTGGMRSFHSPRAEANGTFSSPKTDFLEDTKPHVITRANWADGSLAESYFWLVDYETGTIHTTT